MLGLPSHTRMHSVGPYTGSQEANHASTEKCAHLSPEYAMGPAPKTRYREHGAILCNRVCSLVCSTQSVRQSVTSSQPEEVVGVLHAIMTRGWKGDLQCYLVFTSERIIVSVMGMLTQAAG